MRSYTANQATDTNVEEIVNASQVQEILNTSAAQMSNWCQKACLKPKKDGFGNVYFSKSDIDVLRKVKELSIDNIFHIHHKTDSPNTEYQHSDFFCLPSIYEGTPNALCEAIACGLPVVCSDVSDNSLYVKSGCNGYLMDPLSEVSIAEAIEKLFALTDIQYFEFSKTSREIAESKLSKERFVNEYIGLIEE